MATEKNDIHSDDITLNDIVSIYQTLAEKMQPRPSRLHMTPEFAQDFLAGSSESNVYRNSGILITPDDTLIYGEWKLINQYGQVMNEYRLGETNDTSK